MYCIREKISNKLLGISFTKEGLKYIANKAGNILLFKNAKFRTEDNKLMIVGDLTPNDKVYISEYFKMYHKRYDGTPDDILNGIEEFWEKAGKMKRGERINV